MSPCWLSEVLLPVLALFHISCTTNALIAENNWATTNQNIVSTAEKRWIDQLQFSGQLELPEFTITNYKLQMMVWAIAHIFKSFPKETPQFVICNY